MRRIGFFSLSVNSDKNYIGAVKKVYQNIDELEYNKINLKELANYDVVLIQDDDNQFLEEICQILVYLKAHSEALIWFISTQLSSIHRRVYPQLGVNGLLGSESEAEELVLYLSNTLSFLEEKDGIKSNMNNDSQKIVLVPNTFSVTVEGKQVELTKTEFLVFQYLYDHQGDALSYQEIYKHIWNKEVDKKYAQGRVSNMIFAIRNKAIRENVDLKYVKTIRTRGYMLNLGVS